LIAHTGIRVVHISVLAVMLKKKRKQTFHEKKNIYFIGFGDSYFVFGKERKQNKENVNIESTAATTTKGAPSCVLVNNLPRRTRKPRATGTIWISSFTFEELLRKQIWYTEPKMHGGKQRWVEPRCTIVRRLIDNSSTTKVYNYKTFQIKRSKYANVRMTVPRDTYELLKKISTRLKITEPKITYNEIIWRLIENDKTTK